jgi:hypothetical protein
MGDSVEFKRKILGRAYIEKREKEKALILLF